MRHLITCMGEILIDFLPIEEKRKTIGFRTHPGGSPFNVAVGLARLDAPVAFVGKMSSDFFGRFLREHLQSEGIDQRFILQSDKQSTLAFVAMESGEPAYAFYGEDTADTLLALDELPPAFFEETSILDFGSISLLRGTTPDAVLSAAGRLKGKALLLFDPNIRPSLIRDEVVYRALLDRLFALADIVKVSTTDLAWLRPGCSPGEAASELLAAGPALLVVTQGDRGVVAKRGPDIWQIPAQKVEVADTVGAGDAFTAGMLTSLMKRRVTTREALEQLEQDELVSSLHYAAAVSALTCTRPGSDPPTRAEVSAFLQSRTCE